jgi:hypothetical protein
MWTNVPPQTPFQLQNSAIETVHIQIARTRLFGRYLTFTSGEICRENIPSALGGTRNAPGYATQTDRNGANNCQKQRNEPQPNDAERN